MGGLRTGPLPAVGAACCARTSFGRPPMPSVVVALFHSYHSLFNSTTHSFNSPLHLPLGLLVRAPSLLIRDSCAWIVPLLFDPNACSHSRTQQDAKQGSSVGCSLPSFEPWYPLPSLYDLLHPLPSCPRLVVLDTLVDLLSLPPRSHHPTQLNNNNTADKTLQSPSLYPLVLPSPQEDPTAFTLPHQNATPSFSVPPLPLRLTTLITARLLLSLLQPLESSSTISHKLTNVLEPVVSSCSLFPLSSSFSSSRVGSKASIKPSCENNSGSGKGLSLNTVSASCRNGVIVCKGVGKRPLRRREQGQRQRSRRQRTTERSRLKCCRDRGYQRKTIRRQSTWVTWRTVGITTNARRCRMLSCLLTCSIGLCEFGESSSTVRVI